MARIAGVDIPRENALLFINITYMVLVLQQLKNC